MKNVSLGCLLLSMLAACDGAEASPPADVVEYELFPSTRVLTAPELAALRDETDDGTLTFEEGALADVDVGTVLLAGVSPRTPAGLLRVVLAVERVDGAVRFETALAPLEFAFRRLHLEVGRDIDALGPGFQPYATRALGGSAGSEQSFDLVVFDGDGDETTTGDQVRIDATFGGALRYDLTVDFTWGALTDLPSAISACIVSLGADCSPASLLPEARTTFTVRPSLSLDVDATGAASVAYERDFDVGGTLLPPLVLGPIVLLPTVDVVARAEGGASARFDVGAAANATLVTSVTASTRETRPDFSPPELEDFEFETRPPTLDLHAHAEVSLGVRLSVLLYGVTGPYARASAVARIDAAPLEDPCWELGMALEAELGLRLTTPIVPVTLAEFSSGPLRPLDDVVARGSCVVPEDPPLAPGEGPTPRVLLAPPFTPWAENLGGSVDGSSASVGTLGAGRPDLTLAVDGRFISTGAQSYAAHKFDATGSALWAVSLVDAADQPLAILRSTSTRNAGLALLARAPDDAAFVLAELAQDGSLRGASAYVLPADCVAVPSAIAPYAGGGHAVVGSCAGSGQMWLVHLDRAGAVERARLFEAPGATSTTPTAVARVGDAMVVAGQVVGAGGDEAFVAWLDGEDLPGPTTAFGCPELVTATPRALAPASTGGVTVVGDANGLILVARVRETGALGFARYPNIGAGVATSLVATGIAELPTTGLVIAAAGGSVTGGEAPAVVLAGLDSGGRTLWARRYRVPGGDRALVWPAIRLTDDGGILVAAVAGAVGARTGDLFAMKVFARDGFLGEGTALESEAVALDDYTCTTQSRALALATSIVEVTPRPSDVRAVR